LKGNSRIIRQAKFVLIGSLTGLEEIAKNVKIKQITDRQKKTDRQFKATAHNILAIS